MSETKIHPTAIVEKGAELGKNVVVEAYAVVRAAATLEDNVVVKSHAYIDGNTRIGEGSVIYPFASIGTKTQDLKYKGEKTFVEVGKNCEIREFVTINSSSGDNTIVRVGNSCLIMAYCHIAHNCIIGDHVVMSNNSALAGHVVIENRAIIGGFTPIHQFVRIGAYAMVGGLSRIGYDIPPYTIGGGIPFKFGGLNLVGLKRHHFPLETRRALSRAFRLTFRSGLFLPQAIERIKAELELIPEILHWVEFCEKTKRGLMGQHGIMNLQDEELPFMEEEEPETAISFSEN